MSPAIAVALIAGAALGSGILTALAWRYALYRELLDMPGKRRSHVMVTPRGGGIGPIVMTLAGGAVLVSMHPRQAYALGGCLLGMSAVAAVGWLDDHRPLSARLRLAVHVMAALIAALALLGVPATSLQGLLFTTAVFWIVGLTNVWNFMDGIDGLATSQALLVVLCIYAGSVLYGWLDSTWALFSSLLIGALLGFLPYNFPRARVFLGDVGSGAIGFVIACLLLRAVSGGGMYWPLALLPVSAFAVDAGLTLGKRIAQRKRWWRPHREHLYQWLVRRGASHWRVTCVYALWASAVGLLALGCAILPARDSAVIVAGALLSAGLLWKWARMHLWLNAKRIRRPGAAL